MMAEQEDHDFEQLQHRLHRLRQELPSGPAAPLALGAVRAEDQPRRFADMGDWAEQIRATGPYVCGQCNKVVLDMPGICDGCAESNRVQSVRSRTDAALASIPEEFRTLRFGSKGLAP